MKELLPKGITREDVVVDIKKITFMDKNPNTMSDEEFAKLEASYLSLGYISNITIDENNMVMGGEHRIRLLQHKGYNGNVPATRVSGYTEEQKLQANIALNKVHGHMMHEKLVDVLTLLKESDIEPMSYGYTDVELIAILQEMNPEDFFTDELQKEKEPIQIVCPECGHSWSES